MPFLGQECPVSQANKVSCFENGEVPEQKGSQSQAVSLFHFLWLAEFCDRIDDDVGWGDFFGGGFVLVFFVVFDEIFDDGAFEA